MTLLLSNDEVERLLNMRDCIEQLERAYPELGEGVGVSRTVSQIFTPTEHGPDALYSFKSMDGVSPLAGVAAIRLTSEILTWPKDASGHAKKVRIGAAPNGRFVGLVMLFSTRTGEPLAIFPDGVIQRMRVGATTGLAAKYLARADAREVAMLGCGWQAAAQVAAIVEVRKVARIRCYSPNAARRAAFAQEMRGKTGVEVIASDTGPDAVRGADVVLCATNSWSPVLFADWIEPGMHLSTIQHAEIDPNVFGKADVLVAHYTGGRPAVIDSSRGMQLAEQTEGLRRSVRAAIREHELPNLHDLILGRVAGRTTSRQVTCFLNYVGLGYQFAAVGALLHRKGASRASAANSRLTGSPKTSIHEWRRATPHGRGGQPRRIPAPCDWRALAARRRRHHAPWLLSAARTRVHRDLDVTGARLVQAAGYRRRGCRDRRCLGSSRRTRRRPHSAIGHAARAFARPPWLAASHGATVRAQRTAGAVVGAQCGCGGAGAQGAQARGC
jgi:alanine dehydrogenase